MDDHLEKPSASPVTKHFTAKDIHVDEDNRRITARISTEAVDRDGDVLLAKGCLSEEFLANPIVFFSHVYEELPVGKCVDFRKGDREIIATTEFAHRPKTHPTQAPWMPDIVLDLYRQKVLRGFSVGLDPVEIRPATKADVSMFGKGVRQIVKLWKILEYSVAPIPTNQDALALALTKCALSPSLASLWFPKVFPPAKKKAVVIFLPAVAAPKKKSPVDVSALASKAVDDTIRKLRGDLYSR